MILTGNGRDTFPASSAINLTSKTTPEAASVPSLMKKAEANENARLANETWFNKFLDGPTLDDLMEKLYA